MPPAKATREMKSTYGNVIRTISTARAYFPGSDRNPGAKIAMRAGAATTPMTVTTVSAPSSAPETCAARSRTSAISRRVRYSLRTGTKAWAKAPSANSRRRKFGMRKATKKASAPALAPNACAMTTSRTNPATREAVVLAPTTPVDLRSDRLTDQGSGREGAGYAGEACRAWRRCGHSRQARTRPSNHPGRTHGRRRWRRKPDGAAGSGSWAGIAGAGVLSGIRAVGIIAPPSIRGSIRGSKQWRTLPRHESAHDRRYAGVPIMPACAPECVPASSVCYAR